MNLEEHNAHIPARVKREVSSELKQNLTFKTRHLGAVSAGIIIPPNTIDFKAVFSNFGERLADSPVVLVVITLVFLLYIPLVIWARRKDIRDRIKVSFNEF